MAKVESLIDLLRIDPVKEIENVSRVLREQIGKILKKRGLVVAVSGGIDSSVTLGLAVKAAGPKRVVALMMPEKHSAEETKYLSEIVADFFGCEKATVDITAILDSVGHYQRYNKALQKVIPTYSEDWKSKIIISPADKKNFSFFYIIAQRPDKTMIKARLPQSPYLEIVAATNFKQRIRKMLEYYYADRNNYAVCGTSNRLEYDQGFFVKQGDGAADVKPIAHLYKTQIYQLAEYLKIPEEIIRRPPTTDTYSLPQGQDEFYFAVTYDKMDLCLYGKNRGIPIERVAEEAGLSFEEVENIYKDIERKRFATRYLHMPPLLFEEIPEIIHNA